ncbi:MAG: helix-turn-helix domain-containing protein [Gaiellaceae bacterium]
MPVRENPQPATFSVTQAAAYLGISRAHAFELARRGELPGALRLGERIVVSRSALERAVNPPASGEAGS